ncbi:peptidylprolyl isomerase [Candidatus Calescamantes bacterium]|nr:peptidylprolyl isomerase [Candidatus Calescamantes bacterium]MCK5598769.1 peptidylprolyl isomerase [bacterium]
MKNILIIVLMVFLIAFAGCRDNEDAKPSDSRLALSDYPTKEDIKTEVIVARTPEGITVSAQDVYDWIDLYYSGKKTIILTDRNEMEKLVERILEQKIGVYLAKKRGYDREVDFLRAMQRLKKQYENKAEFNLVKKLISVEVEKSISMTPASIKKYYKEHQGELDRYAVYVILTQCFENSSEAEVEAARKKIFKAYELLQKGEDFLKISRLYTEGNPQWVSSAGALGWVDLGDHSRVFDYNMQKMKAKTYSKPFRSAEGWVIIYVADVHKLEDRYDFIKEQYYDNMVSRLNNPVKEKLLKPFKRQMMLKNLEALVRGDMTAVQQALESDTHAKAVQ